MTFFAETRHSFGQTALMLSGGATFGKYHFGVMKALHEYDLFPRTICGASVGSLTAAAVCARPYEEIELLFDPEFVFKHPMLGYLTSTWWETIQNQLNGRPILCSKTLEKYAKNMIGEKTTFSEIYVKYGWNLNITVTDYSNVDESRLLNYLTAPNVLVWSAVVASCAIPGMFEPVDLMMLTENG